MARPTDAGNFAESAYAQMAPVAYADEQYDWPLLKLVGAIGQMFQQYDDLAHSDELGGPWSKLLDINRIPDEGVAWLGQFLGVQVDTSLSIEDQRQQIRDHEGWDRGTLEYLRRKIQQSFQLHGTKKVIIRERDTSPYHFTVITYTSETDIGNLTYAQMLATYTSYSHLYINFADYYAIWLMGLPVSWDIYLRILAYKPAGLQFTYTVSNAQDYYGIWVSFATYQQVYDAFLTYLLLYNFSTDVGSPGFFKQLVGDTYYSVVWNEYETYGDLYDLNSSY